MNRKKKIIRNIILIILLFFLTTNRFGLYLTPISAHKHSERSIHYGPSEIVHIEDFDKGKYILCKYDKWISCNTVNRNFYFLWSYGSQVTGFENTKSKAIEYTWNMSKNTLRIYGIINDRNISRIEIQLSNGTIFNVATFYDGLFLLSSKYDEFGSLFNIKGYDENDTIVYEELNF